MSVASGSALAARLKAARIVPLTQGEWEAAAATFEEVERHDTGVAGDLLIVQGASGLAAVEAPTSGQQVIRALPDVDAARAFVQERMAQYERMWDGCGCKIDYYG